MSTRETEPLGWRCAKPDPNTVAGPRFAAVFGRRRRPPTIFRVPSETESNSTFTLYRRGIELLAEEDYEHATEQLEQAARRAPEKASIREALGRAYFHSGRFA